MNPGSLTKTGTAAVLAESHVDPGDSSNRGLSRGTVESRKTGVVKDDWGPRVAASVREADGELGKQIFTGTQSGDSQRGPGSEEGTTKTPRWIRDAPA